MESQKGRARRVSRATLPLVGRKNSHRHRLTLRDGQPWSLRWLGMAGVTVGKLAIAACFKSKSSLVALNLSTGLTVIPERTRIHNLGVQRLLRATGLFRTCHRPSGQEANRHARHASAQAPNQRVSKLWKSACDWERKPLRFLLHDRQRIDGASFDQGVRNLLPELARRFVSGHDMRDSSVGSSPLVGIRHVYERPHHAPDRIFASYRTTVEATTPSRAKWKPSDPTCPHWYEAQHLERLIAAYLAHDQDQGGRQRTAREFIAEFRGLSGTAKQKAVLDATGLSREPLSRLTGDGRNLNKEMVGKLLAAMQANSKPVKPKALGIIGEEHLRKRFEAAGCEMESFQYRKIEDDDGLPSVVETAFGWCPDAPGRRLVTGVNWSAGIINPFRQLGAHGQSLDTVLSQQPAASEEPVILVLHQALPRARYTDRGKSAVVTP
jgi:hypothetical protein